MVYVAFNLMYDMAMLRLSLCFHVYFSLISGMFIGAFIKSTYTCFPFTP